MPCPHFLKVRRISSRRAGIGGVKFLHDPTGLDRWAIDTNGEPFSEESKQEMVDFLDMDEDGNLTFKGFLQIYQLQTENDEDETWRDLEKHGYNRSLELKN